MIDGGRERVVLRVDAHALAARAGRPARLSSVLDGSCPRRCCTRRRPRTAHEATSNAATTRVTSAPGTSAPARRACARRSRCHPCDLAVVARRRARCLRCRGAPTARSPTNSFEEQPGGQRSRAAARRDVAQVGDLGVEVAGGTPSGKRQMPHALAGTRRPRRCTCVDPRVVVAHEARRSCRRARRHRAGQRREVDDRVGAFLARRATSASARIEPALRRRCSAPRPSCRCASSTRRPVASRCRSACSRRAARSR